MVTLSNWHYHGEFLRGISQGHEKLVDGTDVLTSPVVRFEPHEDYLDAYTHSGTHYRMYANEVLLKELSETKKCLELDGVDISFLNDAEEKVALLIKQKEEEIDKILEENDLYLEFVGEYMKYGYFRRNGELHKLDCVCHVGMFQDSYLIRNLGMLDVRYFDRWGGIDFYHVSDGINNIHFKHIGDMPFTVTGIGEGLRFEANETAIKTIKPVNCKEGLVSPDCVNGKSLAFPLEKSSSVDTSKQEIDCWQYMSDNTKPVLKSLLENGYKLKVTLKKGSLGCADAQDACHLKGYLTLYKSGDNYKLDDEDENIVCVDDFKYICMILKKFTTSR